MAMSRADSLILSIGRPSSRIRPSVTVSRPLIIRRIVDLPQPEGPTRTTSSPSATVRLIFRTATRPDGYVLLTPSRRSSATGNLRRDPLHPWRHVRRTGIGKAAAADERRDIDQPLIPGTDVARHIGEADGLVHQAEEPDVGRYARSQAPDLLAQADGRGRAARGRRDDVGERHSEGEELAHAQRQVEPVVRAVPPELDDRRLHRVA